MLSNASLEKRFWTESEGFDKQVEMHEIQSDYPGSIDPQGGIERSMADDKPKSFNSENQLVGSEKCSCARKRPRRVDVRPPERYRFEDIVGHALQVAEEVDTCEVSAYREAISSYAPGKWFAAMEDEMESHEKNHTLDLITLPSGRRDVICK